LISALSAETPWLIVDLSDAPFCDPSGLGVLIGAHHKSDALGGGALVAAPLSHGAQGPAEGRSTPVYCLSTTP
jgi:anti-anti-sigma regulatory factor